jgi:hypothetical protein
MFRRSIFRFSLFVAIFAFAASLLVAQQKDENLPRKFKVPPMSSRIEVTVLRDINSKPIENAAVIFHPVEGDRDKGVMELKTNEDGKTMIDVIPIGDTVRLQIIARGFQTYGQDFKVDRDEIKLLVRMKRPGGQYSIYKNTDPASKPAEEQKAQPEPKPEQK